MTRISVIVCTYNRANMLKGALGSLIQQTLERSLYEIILVDNASKDITSQVVQQIQTQHPKCNIVYIYEAATGLGHARNAGVRKAKGTYVAFMDDDAKASANWLETALSCFENVQPTPLCVGGQILPLYDSPKPKWFKDRYEVRTWGEQPRFLKKGESFSGSNMIFRREVFEIYGGFDVGVGVKGEYLSVGEETTLFNKIWQVKDDASAMYYSPQLIVFHAVPNYKMSIRYSLKRNFAAGQVSYIQHGRKSLCGRLRALLGILADIAKNTMVALRRWRKHPAYQNWIVEDFAPIASRIGSLLGYLGLIIPVKQK